MSCTARSASAGRRSASQRAANDADGASDQGHTIGGNKIRFTSEKLHIREDFRWRENLTDDDLAIVRRIAGPLSAALGHEKIG